MASVILETIPVGPFQSNVFILGDEETGKAVVIDPGDEVSRILEILKRHSLALELILLTHGHIDHVSGVKELKEATGAKVFLHREDIFLYEQVPTQASFFGITANDLVKIDTYLEDGMEIGEGDLRCRVIHTPGHTPGSVSFYFPFGIVFTGDTLFRWGVGRTDLWGSSHEELMASIKERLFQLDNKTKVYPGHGPETTIGAEKRNNPYVKNVGSGVMSITLDPMNEEN
ncbi:MAG: MBL fold metallo-hydrolase [Nitrospirae bacterium]|nr:MBL fold metallo-hydrolase [Nitrospirota bacterium]